MQKLLSLFAALSVALLLALPVHAEPSIPEELGEPVDLNDFGVRLDISPVHVRNGDAITLIIQVRPLTDNDDLYFWVDLVDVTVTEIVPTPGRLRCDYRARLFCFVEDLGALEQVVIRGTVTGPGGGKHEYAYVNAGMVDGGFVRIALRLLWGEVHYFPMVVNGTDD